ncbi:MAG: hypothetical protein ACI4HO_05435 [Ruminococcus sp.]
MKTPKKRNNIFTKIAIGFIPVIVLMIAVSIVLCVVFGNNHNLGMLSIEMPLIATFLAFAGIVLAVISAVIDSKKEK